MGSETTPVPASESLSLAAAKQLYDQFCPTVRPSVI